MRSELGLVEDGMGAGKALSPFHPQFCSVHPFFSYACGSTMSVPPLGQGCIPPCWLYLNLLLPLCQQPLVQLTSKIALSCSKSHHSFSFGSQPMWPLSKCLFTTRLKSPLASQSVVQWDNHWFLTGCINLYTIMERKENRGLRDNQSNNFWISVWK